MSASRRYESALPSLDLPAVVSVLPIRLQDLEFVDQPLLFDHRLAVLVEIVGLAREDSVEGQVLFDGVGAVEDANPAFQTQPLVGPRESRDGQRGSGVTPEVPRP